MAKLFSQEFELSNVLLCIFDKDGTLIDVHHYWCQMIELRAECLTRRISRSGDRTLRDSLMDVMGIDIKNNKIKPDGPVGIMPRSFLVRKAYEVACRFEPAITEGEVADVFEEVDHSTEKNLAKMIKVLPGVRVFLEKLIKNNIKIAIATTDRAGRAQKAMQAAGLYDKFDFIAGSDMVSNPKPQPDLVHLIIGKVKIKSDNSVVVGDSMPDLQMALNAKTHFIGVKTGLFDDSFIGKTKFLVDTLEDINIE